MTKTPRHDTRPISRSTHASPGTSDIWRGDDAIAPDVTWGAGGIDDWGWTAQEPISFSITPPKELIAHV